jgi:SAM-dependent methyltransferase
MEIINKIIEENMDINQIKKTFRSPDVSKYPEIANYSRNMIYDGKMGPGGLFLATLMARKLNVKPNLKILDLGCGNGATSFFLAKHYNVKVFAVDLWISSSEIYNRTIEHNLDDKVIPLNLDITQKIPFAENYFDIIFCMDCIHYFGGNSQFWEHLLPYLKNGGQICIGSPCFSDEFSEQTLNNLPFVYDDGTDLWSNEFSKYHSPQWWKKLLETTGEFETIDSSEIEDGVIFWEDDVLYNLENNGSIKDALTDAAQYTFRQDGIPYLTHFVLWVKK